MSCRIHMGVLDRWEAGGWRPEARGWRLEAKGWQGRGGWMDGQTDVQKSPHVFYRTSSPL